MPNATLSELAKPGNISTTGSITSGWINTVPLSTSTNTLSKRSAKSTNTKRPQLADGFIKCYLKKRNLILELLVSVLNYTVPF